MADDTRPHPRDVAGDKSPVFPGAASRSAHGEGSVWSDLLLPVSPPSTAGAPATFFDGPEAGHG